ncbi:DUF1178 family protein [Sulfitobacter aestuarii]|uniref:DUF1178 family protein n=1 Tax=Sulfitobacter aestuarii TaxID=2161676 RepID=A0ABW5U162_9RHOB
MIRYDLKCDQGHGFDSWFRSSGDFESLRAAGHISCATCGSRDVHKAVMAPRLASATVAPKAPEPGGAPTPASASAPLRGGPEAALGKALAELRRRVEANADYVGRDFSRQARSMHLGEQPERAIYGEARPDEARALLEDGVSLLPLPFAPRRKLS